ncbi:type I polyketide synthase [Saccharothrix obliqua]|uniref:type I polyketide synthase n=1 Tax=Saccharothrix obliqua TaxID=2861747 RepID=UPI001C5FC329|nr:type I polyketide synthase [Saccharothrix obliqua]MBW4718331.1 acyltransferase domain-containing protein [Saccharothrix obliqua]
MNIAVVGLAIRVPGAGSPEEFWANLVAGRVSLPGVGDDGLPRAGQLDRVREFDADLFGLPPAHAAATDPQHRVLAELVWEALERAGLDTTRSSDAVGVFAGCGPDTYLHRNVLPAGDVVRALGSQQVRLGNDRDFLATALSYRLGFTGPSMTVQTACSSSLVAVHQAVRALATYECDVAIAGGVTVQLPLSGRYTPVEGGITSADGFCRPFTTGSTGTVPASGAGVVVLRRAEDVGVEPVLAHIVGTAVNNDGADRMNLVAPSPRGQAAVLREALEVAGLSGSDVGFVEAHGTGTALGDQVELSALAEVYRGSALGSVKANVGHTDTAAGVVGLVKAVLALHHGVLPPTPRQDGDGPDVEPGAGLHVPREVLPWPDTLPRRAAVSSFGLGGTNAHVVLSAVPAEPAPAALSADEPGAASEGPGSVEESGEGEAVVVLSAATEEAVREQAHRLAAFLAEDRSPLPDVASALWRGRRQLGWRWAGVARDRDALRAALARPDGVRRAVAEPPVAVVLPGQGGRVAGAGMLRHGPFRAVFAEAADAVRDAAGPVLHDFADWAPDDPRLGRTEVVQPLLFAVQWAALRVLAERGLVADVLLGHSVGELVAAAHAGVFDFADAARAVVRRGALMGAAPAGVMVAVRLGEQDARELAGELDVCVLNAPDNTVLGGRPDAVAEFEERCRSRGVQARRLPTAHAFHSADMAAAAEEFTGFLRGVRLAEPRRAVLSNVTGVALTAGQATDPAYWGGQVRATVRFADCVRALPPGLVVGVDRDGAVTKLARQALRRSGVDALVLDLFGGRGATGDEEPRGFTTAVARAWTAGVDLTPVTGPARHVPLPTYPFSTRRHWLGDDDTTAEAGPAAPPVTPDDLAARVITVWQNAFGGPPLRLEDDFFALGGTSLQAAQLVAVVNEELLLDVRLHDLYECSTLADFVDRVRDVSTRRDDAELLRLLDELEAEEEARR